MRMALKKICLRQPQIISIKIMTLYVIPCFIDEYYYGDENGNYDTQKGLPLKDFINHQTP